jgi:hypothetical protein
LTLDIWLALSVIRRQLLATNLNECKNALTDGVGWNFSSAVLADNEALNSQKNLINLSGGADAESIAKGTAHGADG